MEDLDQLVHADVYASTKHALPPGAAPTSSTDAGPAGQDVNATPTLDAIDAQVARLADADLDTGALSHGHDQGPAMMTPGKAGKKGKKAPKKGKKAASQQQQQPQQQAMQPPMQPAGHQQQGQHAHFQPSLAQLAAKQAAAGTGTGVAGDGQSANGMQSLLSAIELDLTGQGGSFQDREREYLELMHTQFTEEHHERVANNEEFEGEPVDYGLSQLAQANAQGLQTNDLPMNLQLPLLQQQHAAHQHYHQQSQQQQQQQQQRIRPASTAMMMPTPPINRKRKWPGFATRWQDPAARLARIRQVITDHLPLLLKQEYGGQAPTPVLDNRLVTLSCNYAQIGQKSYGHEKRFLTPPPYCTILGHFGPLLGEVPVAHMSVHADIGTQSILQTAERDPNGHIYFKQLHINAGSVGKSKKFSLRLQVAARGARHPAHVPFADFDTDDIFIISKATKKTTKSRMQVPVIRHGGLIALYNRINSQTVRTKYLGEEYGSMILKSESWSPFRIDLFEPGEPDAQGHIPIPYGARVSLSNMETGFVSEPLVVKRVENNLIEEQDQGFVSQMQKLIFERWSPEMQAGGYDGHGQTQATDAGGIGNALDPSLEDQDYGSRYVADPAAEDTSVEQQAAHLLPRYTHASGVNQFEQDDTQAPAMDASGNLQAMQAASDASAAPDAAQAAATTSAPDATTTTAVGDTTTTQPVRYGSRLYLSASRAQRMSKELAGAQADPTTCWDHATLDPRGIPQADDPLCWLVVGVTQFEFSFLDCLDGELPEADAVEDAVPEGVPEEATQMQPELGMPGPVLDQETQAQQQETALQVQEEERQGDEQDDATTSRGGRRKRTRRGGAASTLPVAESPSKRRRRTGKEADLPPTEDVTTEAATDADAASTMRPDDADDKVASLPAAPSETQSEPGMIQTTVDALMSAELPQELEPDFAAINGALQTSQQQQQQQMQGQDEMEPDDVHVETAITPFPVLEARPSVLSNGRLFLLVNHFLQPGSHLAPLEVWLGSVGPLAITRMTQDVTHQTLSAVSSGFVALEVAMPSAQEMLHHKKVPLLFVRQDGLVYISGCEIVIQDGGHSVMDVEEL